MSPRLTFVTVARVLRQLTRDHRTLGLLLVVPVVLMCLLSWIYADGVLFEQVGPAAQEFVVREFPGLDVGGGSLCAGGL